MLTPIVQPGDILAVRSPGLGPRLIRAGAGLRELITGQPEPNLENHIAVVHHIDPHGSLWVIEGRPGGVGWRQADDYLRSPWTVHNALQPKTPAQRKTVCDTMRSLLGTPYDWEAIIADAAGAFGLEHAWEPTWHGQIPGHVDCSSLAAYGYTKAFLRRPDPAADGRETTPADWVAFSITNRFWRLRERCFACLGSGQGAWPCETCLGKGWTEPLDFGRPGQPLACG